MKQDVFLKDKSGNIFIGKVWPGLTAFPDFLNSKAAAYWEEQVSVVHRHMHICMYAHTYTYTHAHTHARVSTHMHALCTHTRAHTHVHTHTCTHTHTHTHTHMCTHAHTHTHTHKHTHTHTHTSTHTHTHARAHTHACTHARTHTHTHTHMHAHTHTHVHTHTRTHTLPHYHLLSLHSTTSLKIGNFLNLLPVDGLWFDMNEISNFCNGACQSEEGLLGRRGGVGFDPNNPPYQINNLGGKAPLNSKTTDMDCEHSGGVLEYNAHNFFGELVRL